MSNLKKWDRNGLFFKLYGAGIEHFVPNPAFQHDFYRGANQLTTDLNTQVKFTVYGDDICLPCNRFENSKCSDPLNTIEGYTSKDAYNQTLDTRLIKLLELNDDCVYLGKIIEKLSLYENIIFEIWQEDLTLTNKRNILFQKGLQKLKNKQ